MTGAWFSPGSLRRMANAPLTGEAVEPVETPPSVADSHLDNLQAAMRQLRDDLAAAEAENARLLGVISAAVEWLDCVGTHPLTQGARMAQLVLAEEVRGG